MGYLPALDGLRGLSVVAVLLYHAGVSWMPGGFLGVDVFFVISGYLITRLLIEERDRTNRISVKAFWLRRARRLLAAVYVLLVTVVLVATVWYREQLDELRGQVFAAITYVTNWYAIAVDQSYFAVGERPPALRHLWSLAVEEQFYIVWPLLVIVMMRVFRGRRVPIGTVVLGGAVLSAIWMAVLFEPATDPSRVYYGTDTRAFALLLGAVLAFWWRPASAVDAPADHRRTRWLSAVDGAGLVAVGALVLAFGRIHDWYSSLYQGGLFLIAALSLVPILAAVHPAGRSFQSVFGSRFPRWVGLRSYSLYLWHWPIYTVTRPGIDWPLGFAPSLAIRLGATVVAAELSYRFVETPIRNGALGRLRLSLRSGDRELRLVKRQVALGGMLAATVLLTPAAHALSTAHRAPDFRDSPASFSSSVSSDSQRWASADAAEASATTIAATVNQLSPSAVKTSVTVISDSVLWSARANIGEAFEAAGWKVNFIGKPALMVKDATELLDDVTTIGDVVVVGLGHNSLWERKAANYEKWAGRFDAEADAFVKRLRELGVKKVVWVTIREPDKSIVPKGWYEQYNRYAWYFPYVNERLYLLHERWPQFISVADWTSISNQPGITGDLIHLNMKGIRMMVDLLLPLL
jgi:peptidoglycan/LPS O-acetylase OafA/YrhL